MYDQATGTYTDDAVVQSFVGKTVRVITSRTIGFEVEVVGTLADLNGKGYYQVHVGNLDVANDNNDGAVVNFNKNTVARAWRATSGNIIFLDA